MIQIDEDVLAEAGLSLPEFVILLFHSYTKEDYSDILQSLWEKGYLSKEVNGFSFTRHDEIKVKHLLARCSNRLKIDEGTKTTVKDLVHDLMLIFPEGRRVDSGHFYRCNFKEVLDSLIDFFSVYGTYPFEDIKRAVQEYVNNFNGDYTYMQLLRNFIFKIDKETGEYSSELASYLENLE